MREIWLISRREFRERVASRSFVLGTLLFPVLVIGLALLPRLVPSGGTHWSLVVIDEGTNGLGRNFAETLSATTTSSAQNTYRAEPMSGTFVDHREHLNEQIETSSIDGYIVLPSDVVGRGSVLFHARNFGSIDVMRDVQAAANRTVQGERLKMAGIGASSLEALIAPVRVEQARVSEGREQRGGAVGVFLAAYAVAFLIYFMTTLYGVAVMHSVLEEKTSRTAELLISAVRAHEVMAGKIIGVGMAAMTQVLVWAAFGVLAAGQVARTRAQAMSDSTAQALQLDPVTAALFFLFFVLGFFLYASMFAIIGASATSQHELQSVQFIALIPLMMPLLFLRGIMNAPLGFMATALGLIPFTAAIAMPMRIASTTVPWLQIVASLVSMSVGIVVVAWVAGKVYKLGILSTGKRPTVSELLQWVRSA